LIDALPDIVDNHFDISLQDVNYTRFIKSGAFASKPVIARPVGVWSGLICHMMQIV